jgi:UDP-N-acetyl-2-amino-2-deoxyglucuronate dehydrogenase
LKSDKLFNFGIIGCGAISERHIKQICRVGRLVAACDILVNRAIVHAKEYNALHFQDIDQLLAANIEMDVLVVCTPNWLHAEHSIKALNAGFHVLCEKPMALTSIDCEKMIRTAEESGKLLNIVKQNRFNPPVMAVKKLIDSGRLGKIFTVQLTCFWNRNRSYYDDSWRGSTKFDGGTLFTQFSHFVDLLIWMVGDVTEANGFKENFAHADSIQFEDSGVAVLKFQNGAIGTINYSINTYEHNMEGSLTFIGEKGTIKIGGQYLNTLDYQNIEGFSIPDIVDQNNFNDYGTYRGSMSNHDKVYDQLVDLLTSESIHYEDSLNACKTVELIELIYNNSKD